MSMTVVEQFVEVLIGAGAKRAHRIVGAGTTPCQHRACLHLTGDLRTHRMVIATTC